MTNGSVAVVRRYLEALRRLDPEAMFAELDEDVVLELPVAPEGMLVVAEYTSEGIFANGTPYANTYVNLCRVRGGKIVETKEFFDPLALIAGLAP